MRQQTTDNGLCFFCGKDDGLPKVNGNHWFANAEEQPHGGHYERVDACRDCYHADAFKRHPRRPRQSREQPRYAASDWNQLVAFMQPQLRRRS